MKSAVSRFTEHRFEASLAHCSTLVHLLRHRYVETVSEDCYLEFGKFYFHQNNRGGSFDRPFPSVINSEIEEYLEKAVLATVCCVFSL